MNPPNQTGRTSGGVPPWEPPSPEALSRAIPAYEVESLLGRGGMGAVYRAKQRSLKRTVAIKVLPPTADDELKFAERFRHEAETLARLNHPGIVHIHDFGETEDGLLYLVMEFVDGTDVHRLIQANGRLSEDYALAVTAHVCDALAYAHSRGIVHRDIKPANVLIDQEGNVKVADFGLAKMVDPQFDSGLTMSNVALGTPDYVAPEVLSYGMEVDHRADLYAVGVMLYQMLTGELPRGLFKLPSQKHHELDPRLDGVICRALEPDRDERYQSAIEVRAELIEISTGRLAKVEDASLVVPSPMPRSWRPKRTAVILACVAGLLVAGIWGGAIWLGPGAASAPVPPAETDLLKTVDFKRDVIAGDWYWDPGGLKSRGSGMVPGERGGYPRVEFAYATPSEYDFEVEFTAGTDEGDAGLVFPVGGKQTALVMNIHGGTGYVAGLDGVGGLPMHIRLTNDGRPSPFFRKGERQVALVQVRKDRVTTRLDGEVIEEWSTVPILQNGLAMGADYALLDPANLGVLAGPSTPITFHRAVLREVGEGADSDPTPGLPSGASAPSGEAPIDWLNASPAVVGQWAPEWNRSNGVSVVAKDNLKMQFGKLENGSVRLQMGLAPGHDYSGRTGPQLQLDLRSGPVAGKPDRTGHYQFQVYLPNRVCSLHYQEKDAKTGKGDPVEALWTGKALKVGELPDEEVEWVFRVGGDRITATADGVEVCSVRDDRVPAGFCMITADTGTRITMLETTGVTPTRPGLPKPVQSAVPRDPAKEKLGESFWGQVGSVNAERKVEIVEAKLEEINRNDLSLEPTIEGGKVTGLKITQQSGEPLHDLSPVGALTDLKTLFCYAPGVRDLEWLRGLPIDSLQLTRAEVQDLAPIRESRIVYLVLGNPGMPPRSYQALAGTPLRSLNLKDSPLKDLSFAAGMPLNRLVISGTGLTDYTVLKSFPLAEVDVDLVPERDLPILLSIPTLKKINGKSVEEYRQPVEIQTLDSSR